MRYSSGVYSIFNRLGSNHEYFLDNQRYEQPRDTMVTIYAKNNLIVSSAAGANIVVTKLADNPDNVIGNVSYNPQ